MQIKNILQRCKVKKDVKRCLKVLQFPFAIIQNPCILWQMDAIYKIMNIGVSIHNMIIENKKGNNLEALFDLANVG
jgi:hypothetical protein